MWLSRTREALSWGLPSTLPNPWALLMQRAPKKGQGLISDGCWVHPPGGAGNLRPPGLCGGWRNLLERYRGQLSGVKRRREAEGRSGSARGLARSSG